MSVLILLVELQERPPARFSQAAVAVKAVPIFVAGERTARSAVPPECLLVARPDLVGGTVVDAGTCARQLLAERVDHTVVAGCPVDSVLPALGVAAGRIEYVVAARMDQSRLFAPVDTDQIDPVDRACTGPAVEAAAVAVDVVADTGFVALQAWPEIEVESDLTA